MLDFHISDSNFRQKVIYRSYGLYFLMKSPYIGRTDPIFLEKSPYIGRTDPLFLEKSPYMGRTDHIFPGKAHIYRPSAGLFLEFKSLYIDRQYSDDLKSWNTEQPSMLRLSAHCSYAIQELRTYGPLQPGHCIARISRGGVRGAIAPR